MVRLIVTDDHRIIIEGIKALLEDHNEIQVVGDAVDGNELLEIIPLLDPNVVLVDIHMPSFGGIEVTKKIREKYSAVKVLALSMSEDPNEIKAMLDAGAAGYLLKTSGTDELVNAIIMVNNGYKYVSPEIAMKLLGNNNLKGTPKKEVDDSTLSKREIEVLQLISDGFTNTEIAEKLFTSKRTIESHRRNLIEKTQTKNTAELIKYSLSTGLLTC